MISQNNTWRGDIGDGTIIEVPSGLYNAAPSSYRNDPLFWQAQSPWEDSPPTPASLPPEQVASRCKQCLRGYVFSEDSLAWLSTAFSLAPCGHPWHAVVPMLQWLATPTLNSRAKDSQNEMDQLDTTAILSRFQTLSKCWEYVQLELGKKIGKLSGGMTDTNPHSKR